MTGHSSLPRSPQRSSDVEMQMESTIGRNNNVKAASYFFELVLIIGAAGYLPMVISS